MGATMHAPHTAMSTGGHRTLYPARVASAAAAGAPTKYPTYRAVYARRAELL